MTNKPTELVVTQAAQRTTTIGRVRWRMLYAQKSDSMLPADLVALRLASTAPTSEDDLDHLAELLANFARDRFANTKELTWATMGEHSQQYFRDAVNVVRAARARKAHQDAIEEAAKVAESFPFSDSAAIAHRIRALIDKEPSE